MGRKIPAKRHRGVKDPLQQLAKKLSELAPKINAPPKNVDEQAVPKSLQRVVKLKEAVKSGKTRKVKKTKKVKSALIRVGSAHSKLHPKAKPDKVIPVFQQNPGENEHHFYYRVCKETNHFLKESEFERKYNVQVDRNPDTGVIEGLSKCGRDEIDELAKLKAKHKNIKKKKKKKDSDNPKLTKSQKRKQKLQIKKEKKEQENMDEFKTFNDQVQFGEIVHEPPQLTARPKNSEKTTIRKPITKGLLLNSMLKDAEEKTNGGKNTSIDRLGKRKNLPIGERRQIEKQQKNVIAAYRKLKAQKSAGLCS